MVMSDVGLAKTLRAPVQGRSKASYERMLSAAEELMRSEGSCDFTLNAVSRKGKVSIGSIYNRFESKEDLLHAVQLRVVQRVDETMRTRLLAAKTEGRDLPHLIFGLVEALAETLYEHQEVLRPLMTRATDDALVAETGKASYVLAASSIKEAMLEYTDQIKQPNPKRAVDVAFRVTYSTIARYLGLGSAMPGAWEGEWSVLKEDLSQMVAAFLGNPPIR